VTVCVNDWFHQLFVMNLYFHS